MESANDFFNDKAKRLYIILGGFFIANAIIAELIGVKIFSLERTLSLNPINVSLFGIENLSFNLTCGVLLWPIVFVMTDIINEYYGTRGVKFLSFLAVGLISYAFLIFFVGVRLEPADFWPTSHILSEWTPEKQQEVRSKVGDFNFAFGLVLGQGTWIIIGSLVAFLIGQILDVYVFHKIKRMTGEKYLWLRSTGSTLISQFVDSFVVLFIAFYIGAGWNIQLVLAIGLINYLYKFLVAILLTPVIYMGHQIIDRYLGHERAAEMKKMAHIEN